MSLGRTMCVCVLSPAGRISATACAVAMCDLVKYVLYQKLQVPYSYELLRRAVHGRCIRQDARESIQSTRHFRTVSLAFESLETIFKSLSVEMNGTRPPVEVCLVLGATLVSCREAYRLVLPARHHKPSCRMDHTVAGHQLSMILFKTLTTSEVFDEIIIKPLSPTNLHILIRKTVDPDSSEPPVDPEHFTPSRGCRVPRNAKLAVIHLPDTSAQDLSCCSGFEIFDEYSECENKLPVEDSEKEIRDWCVMESNDKEQWFQATVVVKGFKDCCVNGNSVANEWLKL